MKKLMKRHMAGRKSGPNNRVTAAVKVADEDAGVGADAADAVVVETASRASSKHLHWLCRKKAVAKPSPRARVLFLRRNPQAVNRRFRANNLVLTANRVSAGGADAAVDVATAATVRIAHR